MLFLLILATTLAIWTVYLWRATQRLPKGPFPLPLIGNFHQIAYTCWKAGGTVAGFHEFKKQYGKVFTLWMGPQPTVHIVDIETAQETHVRKANVFGHRYSNGGTDYIREGRGILASNGEFWQEHRRFALKTLRDFGLGNNIMEEKIMEEYRYRFQDYKKTNFKNGGIEVHVSSCFDLLVGSIINILLVSERFEQNDADFERMLTTGTAALEKLSVLDSFVPLWLMKSRIWQWRTKEIFGPSEFVHSLVERNIQRR
ncbi:hypothetical protein B9Z55_017797 [Caenorhabditis nigoni]|uniref:Cytochrome P450 n=1 Tax=Caenorhabditis nigoni TaxID=1611254 RepID=A0A2G5TBA2_9PELO|nr:hypothetical protein B9Z55_017797 [Caenorhabditis nigoni]